MHPVLDDAERAVSVGNQLVNVMTASSNAGPASSSHVNRVADAMISMFTGADNAEEEEQSESDVDMETQSERMRRYLSSEMCEISDPEGWMVYHHGVSDDEDP